MSPRARAVVSLLAGSVLLGACSIQDPAPTPTTAPPPPATPVLRLEPDGLGIVSFGAEPELVVDELTPLVGGPDEDTGWIIGGPGIYGDCPSDLRVISFGSLVTFFTGGPDAGEMFAYSYGFDYDDAAVGVDPRDLGITTTGGIGLGSTVSDVVGAGGVVEGDTSLDLWSFALGSDAGPHLRGALTGPDPADTVLFIETSSGCT